MHQQLHLIEEAARTHHPHPLLSSHALTKDEKVATIAAHFQKIMEALGLDLTDPSLKDTPQRVARMYVYELFIGLDIAAFPDIAYIDNAIMESPEGMVCVKDIPIKSICEHHFVPFIGKANVAYLPKDKIVGLSKIHRIVDYFCRRPQLQERLTGQIADSLTLLLACEDVAVFIEAEHFCITLRGVQHPSRTHTSVLRGLFQKDAFLKAALLT